MTTTPTLKECCKKIENYAWKIFNKNHKTHWLYCTKCKIGSWKKPTREELVYGNFSKENVSTPTPEDKKKKYIPYAGEGDTLILIKGEGLLCKRRVSKIIAGQIIAFIGDQERILNLKKHV